ncbi:MAG: helicase C-terminal domain-containing protein [Spirochaetota bacterium]
MSDTYRDINALFTPGAIASMRSAIAEADGNEVYFGGNFTEGALVGFASVIARGNRSAVPAIINSSLEYDLVIHNHPGGNLSPSNADVGVASELGNAGVGFVIIDSDVSEMYVVVDPLIAPKAEKLDIPGILFLFTENGDLKKYLSAYEYRHEQTVMVERVLESFNENTHLMVEAGTGVGKSLAYLVPAILWVKANKGRIVVSTNTINLQQQIILKDLPDIIRALAPEIPYALVKGRNNYVCIRKVKSLIAREQEEAALDLKTEEEDFIRSVNDWLSVTSDGSMSDLSEKPRSSLWELVQSEGDSCTKTNCDHYTDCFYYRMRKEINRARILIVNHHILCADLSIHAETGGRFNFLPRYEKVVIDEAHNFEESASRYFGNDGSKFAVVKNINLLYSQRGTKRFGYAQRMRRLIEGTTAMPAADVAEFVTMFDRSFIPACQHARDVLELHAKAFLAYCREHIGGGSEGFKFRVSEEFSQTDHWQKKGTPILRDIVAALTGFVNAAEFLKTSFVDSAITYGIDYQDTLAGAVIYIDRLKSLVTSLSSAIAYDADEFIRWFEVSLSRKGALYLSWHLTPVEVASYLNRFLYSRFDSVVMTSATLTVDKSFSFFEERLGLTFIPKERLVTEHLTSPYDYQNNARMYVATDVSEPNDGAFTGEISRYLLRAMEVTKGRCFVLFTSFSTLRAVYDATYAKLTAMGLTALTQSGEYHRNTLIEMFRQSGNNILFGVDSFWEGVDVVGDNLQMIIIPKMPFSVPTDPVTEARQEYIRRKGGNPFIDYIIPLAVIKFKQGFGRLIRSKKDRGVVLVLDKRILMKNYGAKFINSLPDVTTVRGGLTDIIGDMNEFFGG